MRRYDFVTVDVFTGTRFGGNPLAVFPDARGLSDAEMQALAAEFNLSETTFVLPPDNPANTARVRIFTRQYEMPFAGHPNVGTGWVLRDRAMDGVLRFEEIAGLVEVRVAEAGTTIAAPQPLTLGVELPVAVIARAAGLEPADVVASRHPPVQAGTGNPFVIAEVTPAALGRAQPDFAGFRAGLAATPALGNRFALYLYAQEGAAAVRARMFAPLGGTVEDAATGSAATPLAALLLQLSGAESGAWDITQGVEMGRPSLLRTTARRAADGIRATVGGGCVPVLRGEAML
ncbi:PhzF family phenazine biosynthesis protein [Falsiroseomonas selenitidurans]|uniref:PhzF family phenazine biosynthesis protein n=1 Tax=Falsiroseomonas selenitidurans TaxID=2716335 RepID=A0ABX1EDW9_9PROT|nr:PhzF family phenazine biosynthesis protein [Falsiroseomonas selenitidurans]NKC33742.1 PhzF family phenazine biosynthesis protein [Falsiroseomonas selenitidurans]